MFIFSEKIKLNKNNCFDLAVCLIGVVSLNLGETNQFEKGKWILEKEFLIIKSFYYFYKHIYIRYHQYLPT